MSTNVFGYKEFEKEWYIYACHSKGRKQKNGIKIGWVHAQKPKDRVKQQYPNDEFVYWGARKAIKADGTRFKDTEFHKHLRKRGYTFYTTEGRKQKELVIITYKQLCMEWRIFTGISSNDDIWDQTNERELIEKSRQTEKIDEFFYFMKFFLLAVKGTMFAEIKTMKQLIGLFKEHPKYFIYKAKSSSHLRDITITEIIVLEQLYGRK